MTGVLRAELLKLFKRRTYWVLSLVLALLTGLIAFVFFLLPRIVEDAQPGLPAMEKPEAYIFGAQQVLGQTWFPLILAVMLLAGELATSTWATALTRNARRRQHLIAKLVLATVGSWLAMLAAMTGWTVVAYFFADGSGFLELAQVWDVVWKALLIMLGWVALGLAASAWLRSVGPAIGAVLAFSFGEGLLSLWAGWRQVSLSIHTTALLGELETSGLGDVFEESPTFTRALAVVLGWAVVAIVAAWAGLQYRDP